MDKKKIQFLFSGEIFKLPPFLTILDCLKDEFTLKVLCYETAVNFSKLQDRYQNDDIEFENVSERIIDRSLSNRRWSAQLQQKNRIGRGGGFA